MSNVRRVFTYTALRRHRGDGRAIYETRTKRVEMTSLPPMKLETGSGLDLSPFAMHEMRIASWSGGPTNTQNLARRWGKHMFLSSMAMRGKRHPRDVVYGPFKVVLDKKKRHARNKLGEFQQGHKVINVYGERVHRGTKGSCEGVADQLNLEHCKWLMLPDSDDRYIAFDAQVAINRLIDSQVMNTMNPQWKMPP